MCLLIKLIDMSTEEGEGGFELVTFTSLGVISAN
jgi:hypothetical protein